MEPATYISIIISATSTFLGILIFIIKRFRRCKIGCIECECKGATELSTSNTQTNTTIQDIPQYNSSPV